HRTRSGSAGPAASGGRSTPCWPTLTLSAPAPIKPLHRAADIDTSSTALHPGSVATRVLNPGPLAHGDHTAGADREPLPVLLQVPSAHLAGTHDDVLVQDRVAYHRAPADPGARHDDAALDDRAVVDHDVRRQHRVTHGGGRDDAARTYHRLLRRAAVDELG